MGKVYSELDDALKEFIRQQHLFFVATAPLNRDGLINLSPKGLDTFQVLGSTTVAYLDLTGSGIETVAHIRENERITLMFCAFSGPPRILRLYGRGRVIEPGTADWNASRPKFGDLPGARSIIEVKLTRIADSCGFGVPLCEYVGPRSQLIDYAQKLGDDGLAEYRARKNQASIDGLPGMG